MISAQSQFLHYNRVVWSFAGSFKAPLVAVVPDDTCAGTQAQDRQCQHPSLLMFDTETIARIGLPNATNGGTTEWLAGAKRHSMLYIGSARLESASDTPSEMPIPRRWLTAPSTRSARFNVLVLLEGREDATTGLVFKDIADIVHDGLQSLGHESRIVYCANLVVDNCFMEGEIVVVLAPHILARYFTEHGTLAATERHLVPSDAGDTHFSTRPEKRAIVSSFQLCRSIRYSLDDALQGSHCLMAEKGGKIEADGSPPAISAEVSRCFSLASYRICFWYLRRIYRCPSKRA